MTPTALRQKVIEEIQHIPEEKLREIYNVIHFFRVGVESVSPPSNRNNIMAFAGCWDDMPDEDFDSFLLEVENRRANDELDSPKWHKIALAETEKRVEYGQEKMLDWSEAKRRLRSNEKT